MSPVTGFVLSFAFTIALLAAAVVAGFARKRTQHVVLVILAMVSLAWTINRALRLGRVYDLESAGPITPVHLTLAKATALFLILPVLAGMRLLRTGQGRVLHRELALAALALVVLATISGIVMMALAKPW